MFSVAVVVVGGGDAGVIRIDAVGVDVAAAVVLSFFVVEFSCS